MNYLKITNMVIYYQMYEIGMFPAIGRVEFQKQIKKL